MNRIPTLDGVLEPGEWKDAIVLSGFTEQQSGNKNIDATEAWVGVSEAGIYVAIYAHDSQPDKIVARTIQKGAKLENDDFVGLIIDPMNRKQVSGNSQFFVNPLGTQDENIAGGRAAKKEWRGTWLSAAKRVSDGYIVEMMVPWRLLAFPAGRKGDVLFNVARVQARTQDGSYALDPGRPFRVENHGTLLGVQFPKRNISDQLDLLGYVSPEYDVDESPQTTLRGGVDIRYRPTETLNTVLSLSPDFKNIEGQVEGIGFTRTERLLGDTRPFFTEGANYFNLTGRFGFGQVFYSNRIDDFDQGFKFFGDFDQKQRLGFLVSREDGNRLDSVLRYGRTMGPRSSVSLFSTYRDEPGRKNSVIGGTAIYGTGNYEFGLETAHSEDGGQPGMANRVYANYNVPNYFLTGSAHMTQPEFRARLGFIPFIDQRGGYIYHEYNRKLSGSIRQVHFDNNIEDFEHFDGTNLSRDFSLGSRIETQSDWAFGLNYNRNTFESEVTEQWTVGAGWNVSNQFKQIRLDYSWGDQAGFYTSFFSLRSQFRIGKGLDLGLNQSIFKLAGNREQSIVSLGWEIDPEQSLTGRYVKTDRDSNWYIAYRKSGGLGLEYFVIIGDPNAREYRNRAAFKVVWAK
ncbi:MAG: hypothetical protein ACKVQS_04230 [Fimbriimonadaceae bacterium]